MITLIGEDLAEVGLSFIFDGPAKVCESCRFKASCVDSLEKGRKYIINNVKDITQKCPIHDGGIVKAVEIDYGDVKGLIDSKKVFEGSNITLSLPDCDLDCIYHHLCFPEGLFENDKCIIIKNLGKNESGCLKGFQLTKACLRIHL
ncbi:hypothetical protein ALNOE001_02440 [Candidatus Methanobinarius endosymbioticus]|uniref:UPF0179 protein ALNOE001_02440 n=1 Tax=Candidatus Methanobinarius endosymbioticus TaxID=2006182 RepID=A0A366MDJ0_9EURY|nr:hypothetical protein ALNOE001_02440 [Candidatus Methanobinarius endosymbioticus]